MRIKWVSVCKAFRTEVGLYGVTYKCVFNCCSVSKLWLGLYWGQHASLLYPSLLLGFAQVHVHWASDALWPTYPLLPHSLPAFIQSFSASEPFPMSCLFTSGSENTGVSASASVLPMNIQGWFPLGLIGLISLHSKHSQEFSPAPQFKNISSSVLSLLYAPTLISLHDYWKNHSFDYIHFCRKSDVSAY